MTGRDEVDATGSHLGGRVVVVTGAGGGFGRLIAEMAAARGARAVVGDIDGAAASSVAGGIVEAGGEAIGVTVDVCDRGQVDALVAAAVDAFGAVDVMVNNAGIMPLAFFADHADAAEAWDRCIDVNLKGTLHGICAAYDRMAAQGRGHVVNISSIYAGAGTPGSGVYSATKAAVAVLSDSLRKESQGLIKVTVVRPTGVLGTGLGAGVVNPAAIAGITGAKAEPYMDKVMAALSGTLGGAATDEDDPGFWAIEPATIAAEVVHAIDQPWGITISDVTVRATGEDYTI
ncbi:SDR family oxidoreductase [Dermatobacter hominis]|uniref:SDR family oxidoreductase n=1 Tax=Dermatobacter hominis TaxID=2884263 RepID=UPI001D102F87|nr:SDR family NAD(P)-dependent oxidoreductase [Dermatobacter hominis]UDY36601.1 SDR family NAD(P)-dependent oxidoreductase [Dermatobacter hominis]